MSAVTSVRRRLGIDRPSLIETASEAADCGFWLALVIGPDVSPQELAAFGDSWNQANLASITDVMGPIGASEQMRAACADVGLAWWDAPRVVAAAKGAERVCRSFRGPQIAVDEAVPEDFDEACFETRAERDKSFVRCTKALVTGVVDGDVDRVSLWTSTPKVLTACQAAIRNAGVEPHLIEFCLPAAQRSLAERLLTEGQMVRLCFVLDRPTIDRTMARLSR